MLLGQSHILCFQTRKILHSFSVNPSGIPQSCFVIMAAAQDRENEEDGGEEKC